MTEKLTETAAVALLAPAYLVAGVVLVVAWPVLRLAVAFDNRSLGLPWNYGGDSNG